MKTTLIFASLFLFAALMGCSDSISVNDPFNHETASDRNPASGGKVSVVFESDDLTVNATNEFTASNKVVYSSQPFAMITNYWVSFDVTTNADKLTNGYLPLVQIFRDDEVVFESSAYPGTDGGASAHVEVALENTRFENLTIRVTLTQGDDPTIRTEDSMTYLTLSKISISRED